MKISLIMCTLGRLEEVELFIRSLCEQSYVNYELIVVDQNSHSKIEEICNRYTDKLSSLKYHRVQFKGLSKSRNFGLKEVTGDIVAFPDDDCIYPADALEKVVTYFKSNNTVGIISGQSISELSFSDQHVCENIKSINMLNMFGNLISYTIFLKKERVDSTECYFDEELGVGSKFGSTEETDFIFRQISSKNTNVICMVVSDLLIFHPDKDSQISLDRTCYYNTGVGAFVKKHASISLIYLAFFMRLMLVAPLAKIAIAAITCNKRKLGLAYGVFSSRWQGFFNYGK
ncbi:glycosyltransferase family 2 protein [Enterobacillus tribolii]|uniref:Glycosyl transferase family 2 n=1 Tax=Enterobacillus tribolii TaxID=1487935 RepID=A0A370R2P4_9GAMM|nr:glycosyltransferase family 2 protein [Enterobacillus tribolii]MBW7984696.1 glycosyltransferase family 2 protein [Enterobacillus tribolii]RDK96693.1 glycosyl transferase family 2 [Enterobacillus tribolii]